MADRKLSRCGMLLGCSMLAGCAVGPRYHSPVAPLPPVFAEARGTGFDATTVAASEVWTSFAEPELDALIVRAQQQNRSIAQASARLDEARAMGGLTTWSLLPSVTAAADRERSEPSGRDPFLPPGQGPTTVYRAGFDDWAAGRATPLLPGPARHVLTLSPPRGAMPR